MRSLRRSTGRANRFGTLVGFAIVLGADFGWAQADPIAAQFQVNTTTLGNQREPALAHLKDGGSVVVWRDQTLQAIFGQRFSSDGTRIGAEFQVSDEAENPQKPRVWFNPLSGKLLSIYFESSTNDLYGRMFRIETTAPTPVAETEFIVRTENPLPPNNHYSMPDHDLTGDDKGGYLVVWSKQKNCPGGAGLGNANIWGAFVDVDANVETPFRVNCAICEGPYHFQDIRMTPAIAASPPDLYDDQRFIAAWADNSAPTDIKGRIFRRHEACPTPPEEDTLFNIESEGAQFAPAVASGPFGSLVVWDHPESDPGHGRELRGRFVANNDPESLGSELHLNSLTTTYEQRTPSVGMDDQGNVVVVWNSGATLGSDTGRSAQARRFDPQMNPLGLQFQVNDFTGGSVEGVGAPPRVAVDPESGNFVVAWQSTQSPGDDNNGTSVQARALRGALIDDGFETCDLSRWDGAIVGGGSQQNALTVSSDAAIHGDCGLDVLATAGSFATNSVYAMANRSSPNNYSGVLSFSVNLRELEAPILGAGRSYRFLTLQTSAVSSNENKVFFLQRQESAGNWRLVVWSFDPVAGWVSAGSMFLALYGADVDVQVTCRWRGATSAGASNGYLRCDRTAPGGTPQFFETSSLNDFGRNIGRVSLGFLDFDGFPGIAATGHAYFDDFSFSGNSCNGTGSCP